MAWGARGRESYHEVAEPGAQMVNLLTEIAENRTYRGSFRVYDVAEMPPPTKKSPSESQIVLNTLMMPEHANHFGNVHGGIIMKLADEAAAIAAMRHAQKPAVTVAVDSMTFQHPVHIGEIVRCTATLTYAHHSSMEVTVEVCAEEPISGRLTHTNSAHLVFVALGDDGRPSPVPELVLETEEEKANFAEAERRQQERLARRRRKA